MDEFTNVRPLPPPEPPAVLPDRMKHLPVSPSLGLPIPWHADIVGGEPEFKLMRSRIEQAVNKQTCWICGDRLGQFMAFTLYPLSSFDWGWSTSEPPSHKECAIYSARVPIRPPQQDVTLIWICKGYRAQHDGGRLVIYQGNPIERYWYTQGRTATRIEAEAAIAARVLILQELASNVGPAVMSGLSSAVDVAQALLPPV